MFTLMFLVLILKINPKLLKLQTHVLNQVELPDISSMDFGFGGYFQYSPIFYQMQGSNQMTFPKMLLGALIQKETQQSLMIIYAQLNSENQVIDHVLILDGVKKLQYSVQPLLYEGKWFLFYFKYRNSLKQVEILISDTALSQKKIYKFDNSLQIHKVKYIIQFAGYFNNPIDNVYYSFYKGLYYQIVNTTANFDIISETSILSNTGSAKCSCQYISTLSNTDFYINKTSYYKGSISQGCYDYSIQTWVKIVDYNAKLPIEIISVSHNQNVDYYNHIGGIAFRMYYQFINELLNINIVTYSYTFPSFEIEIQPDPNLISFKFQNVEGNISNWHYFKFEKLVASTTFTLTFPTENIQLKKIFGKLNQFSLPQLNYYLAGSLLSEQNITAKYFNLTIDHCYKSTVYKIVCHISCLTCNGPTLHDCLSCDSVQNRELIDNLCACKLGYLEQYLKGCSCISIKQKLDFNKQYYNITSIPITDEFPTGYQQIEPYLICQYGYFQIQNICVKCPSIQNENIITCIECLTEQYNWQYSLACKSDMVKQFEIFQKQTNLRYFYFDNNLLVECINCNNIYHQSYLKYPQLDYGENLFIDCEYGNIFVQLLGFYYSDLKCLQKQNYLQTNVAVGCGQFCDSCDAIGQCLYCLEGKYFRSSDGINCELCLIENCEYCYIFDLDDQFYETLRELFSSRTRTLATLRVGCAKCVQGYYFDFTSLKCTLESHINNCEQQIQHNNQVICLLSSLTDFSISDAINNCNEQLENCKQCYFNPMIFSFKCNICEINYSVDRITGLCVKCFKENCLKFDVLRSDRWLQQLEPFYNLKYPRNPIYDQYDSSHLLELHKCESKGCNVCNSDLSCYSCPSSKYGQKQQSQKADICIECSYLCNVCLVKTIEQYALINPHFINDIIIQNQFIYQCLKSADIGYINGDNMVLQCDQKPCKMIGNQIKALSCLNLLMLSASRSANPLDLGIDSFYLQLKAVEQFNFEYQLNYQGDCKIFFFKVYSLINQLTTSVRQVKIKFQGMFGLKEDRTRGQIGNEKDYTKVSINPFLTFEDYSFVSIEDIIFSPQHSSLLNVISIIHNIYVLEAQLTNLIILDQFQSGFSIYFYFLNVQHLLISNFTLINISAINVNFFNTSINSQKNLQTEITITNMSIINSTFQNGCFLNLTDVNNVNFTLNIESLFISNTQFRDYDFLLSNNIFVGNLQSFRNITIQNCSFINSTFFNLNFNDENNYINQLLIINSIFYNQSRLISSNKINLDNMIIMENQFYDSQLIYITYELKTNQMFSNLQVKNNKVQSNQPLIQVKSLQSNFTYYQIIIFNNTHNPEFTNSIIFNSVYFLQLVEIQVYNDLFDQMIIFQLQQSYQIQIKNSTIHQINNQSLNVLTSTQECFKFMDTQNIFRIFDSNLIFISNLNISKFIVVSNPVIQIFSNFIQQEQSQQIQLEQMIVSEIILVKISSNMLNSIISITNQNSINIELRNCKFIQIWMHQYVPDYDALSSAILSINSVYATTNIYTNLFKNIMITNSTNSIMKLNVQTLTIQNSQIQYINSRNISLFNQFIFWDMNFDSFTSFSQLEEIFEINSEGGFINIQAQDLTLNNLIVDKCYAQNGGFAKITTKGNGVLKFINSHFSNTEAFVTSSQSKGGLFYIVSDNSLLNLYMENCSVEYATARQSGGSIYITPSTINNIIMIRQSSFAYCSSDEGAILTAKFLDSILSRITLDSVEISNISIEEYIKQLNYISKAETMNIQVKNYAIVVYQSSYFHLKNCNFYNQDFTGFLSIENTPEIQIYNVTFQNFTFAIDSSIYIGYTKVYQINMIIDKILVRDGKPKTFQFDADAICKQKSQENKIWYCNKAQTNPKVLFDQEDRISVKNCIFQQLVNIQKTRQFNPLINIDCNKNYFKIKISRLQIHNISMSDNNYGLFQLILSQIEENICKFSEILLTSNTCGLNGCFLLIQTDLIGKIDQLTGIFNILDTNNTQNTRILQSNSQNYITMNYCQFYNNSAFKGAGIVIVNLNTIIQNSQFISNVVQTSGSFIYFFQTDSEIILSNIDAFDNFATYGQIFKIGHYLPFTTTSVSIYSEQYQIDQVEYPVSLTLMINSNRLSTFSKITQNMKEYAIIIKPYTIVGQKTLTDFLWFPSGQSLSTYQYFEIYSQNYIPLNISGGIIPLNSKNEQISYLQNSYCFLYQRIVNSDQSLLQEYEYLDKILYNESTKSYNLDQILFIFDPYQEENNYLQIKVKCDCIQDSNYFLSFKIKTFQCQLGEYYYYGQCLICNPDQSYYSLDPKYGKCEIQNTENTIAIKSAMVQLKKSFWRYKVKSNIISYCINNPSNCEGGWEVGQNSCKLGYLGALCEECDLYDIRGAGKYSKSKDYNCIICSDFAVVYIKAILIVIWTFLSILLTCNSVIQSNKYLARSKLTNIHYKILYKLESTNQLSILIKMTTNFIQIISIVSSFHIKLSFDLNFGLDLVGNPVKQISTFIDCSLVDFIPQNLAYYKIIVSFLLVLILINICFILYAILLVKKKIVYTNSVIWIIVIYVFLLTQPGLINELSSLLAYRTIAKENWVKAQVNLLYDTPNNYFYLMVLVLPFLFLLVILIPAYFTKQLYQNKSRTFQNQFRKKFSYLINEYREGIWYWEIVKLSSRVLIIVSLNYYSDYIYIKSSLVYLIIVIYQILLLRYQPYNSKNLTKLEIQSVFIQISIIIFGAAAYSAQIDENSIQFLYLGIIFTIMIFQLLTFLFKIFEDIWNTFQKKLQEGYLHTQAKNLSNHSIIGVVKDYIQKRIKQKEIQKTRIKELKSKIMEHVSAIIQLKSSVLPNFQKKTFPQKSDVSDLMLIQQNILSPQNMDILFTNRQEQLIENHNKP